MWHMFWLGVFQKDGVTRAASWTLGFSSESVNRKLMHKQKKRGSELMEVMHVIQEKYKAKNSKARLHEKLKLLVDAHYH